MHRDKLRMFRQEMKKIIPKKVNITAVGLSGFCKFGRIHGTGFKKEAAIVIPMKGNQNNNWKTS